MRIITLGTSAGRPTPERSASCVALEFDGESFLFDCGEGTQLKIIHSPLRWGNLKAIFITHLHGDHINGLPGLLGTLSSTEREAPLKIFGPRGIRQYIAILKELRTMWIGFPLEITEVNAPGVILDSGKYQVETAKLDHIIECWGYVFREKDRPGHFDEQKAKKMNVPFGPIRADLVAGKNIILGDGTVIRPEELIGPKRPGRSVAYCLDTKPCEGDLILAKEVDLLIHEATFDDTLRKEIETWGHSTAAQAAEVATQSKVKQLLLTHISPRYPNAKILLQEARNLFKNSEIAFDLSEWIIHSK